MILSIKVSSAEGGVSIEARFKGGSSVEDTTASSLSFSVLGGLRVARTVGSLIIANRS